MSQATTNLDQTLTEEDNASCSASATCSTTSLNHGPDTHSDLNKRLQGDDQSESESNSLCQGGHTNFRDDDKDTAQGHTVEVTLTGVHGESIIPDDKDDKSEETKTSREDQMLLNDVSIDVDDTSSESVSHQPAVDTGRDGFVTVKAKDSQVKLTQLKVSTKPIERPRSRTPINLVTLDEYASSGSPEKSPSVSKINITLPGEEFESREKSPRKSKDAAEKNWFSFNEAFLFSHSRSAFMANKQTRNESGSQTKTLNEMKAEKELQQEHSSEEPQTHTTSTAVLEQELPETTDYELPKTTDLPSSIAPDKPVSSAWEVFEEKPDLSSKKRSKRFLLSTPSFEAQVKANQVTSYNDALDPFMSQNATTTTTQAGGFENNGLGGDKVSSLFSELPGLQEQSEDSQLLAEAMPKKHKSGKKTKTDDLSDIIAKGPKPRAPGEFVPYEERIDEDSEEWQKFQQMQERIKQSVQKTQENVQKLAAKAEDPNFLKPQPNPEPGSDILGLSGSNMDEPELDLRLQVHVNGQDTSGTNGDFLGSLPASSAQAKSTDDLLGLSLPEPTEVQAALPPSDPFELDDETPGSQETSTGLSSIVDDFLGIDESSLIQKPVKSPEEILEELARNKHPLPSELDAFGFEPPQDSETQHNNGDLFDLGIEVPPKTEEPPTIEEPLSESFNLDAFELSDQQNAQEVNSGTPSELSQVPVSPSPSPGHLPRKAGLPGKIDLTAAVCALAAPVKAFGRLSPLRLQGTDNTLGAQPQNELLDIENSAEPKLSQDDIFSGGSHSSTPSRGYSSDNPFRSISKSDDSTAGEEDHGQFVDFLESVSKSEDNAIGFDPFSTIEPTGHDHEHGAVGSFDPFATIVDDDLIDGGEDHHHHQKVNKDDFDPFAVVEETTPQPSPSPTKKEIAGAAAPPRLRDLKDILGESCADDVMPVEDVDDPFKTTEAAGDASAGAGDGLDLFDESSKAFCAFESEGAFAADPSASPSMSPDKDRVTSSRFNPFNKTSPEDEVADESGNSVCKDASGDLTPTPDSDPDFEPLEDYFPSAEGKVWKLLLRQPGKKTKNLVNRLPGKLPGSTKRSWRNVWVKLVLGKDGKTLIRLHDSDKTDARAFQEVPLLTIYDFSNINLQQYDQFGKIHTVKLQQITFKERPGLKPEKLMTEISYPNFLERFRPKPTMVLDHQPAATELLKFGSLNYDEIRSFVWMCEDALLRTEAHREKTQIYTKDEVQVLAQDEYMAIVDKEGHIMSQKARARIFVLAFVTGMPPCELGLNDKRRKGKEVVGRKDIIPIKTDEWIAIQQYEFHSLVDIKEFEKTGLIKFYPLDGTQFELLRFRVKPKQNLQLPLQVQTQMTVSKKHVEIRADVMVPGYFTESARSGEVPCENIMIRFPIPEPWIYYFREERLFKYGSLHSVKRKPGKIKGIERITALAQGFLPQSLMEASAGTAKYEHIFGAIVWRIDRLPGKTEGAYKSHLFTMKLDLGPHDPIPDSYKQYADVEFTMPNTTISGTQVRSISVGNPNNPERWVKYVGKYEYQVEIDLKIEDEPLPSQAPEEMDSGHSSED